MIHPIRPRPGKEHGRHVAASVPVRKKLVRLWNRKMPAHNSHSLTLYCDNLDLSKQLPYPPFLSANEGRVFSTMPGEHHYGEFPVEFIAPLMKTCYQMARTAGWKFRKDGRTICPRCVSGGLK